MPVKVAVTERIVLRPDLLVKALDYVATDAQMNIFLLVDTIYTFFFSSLTLVRRAV